MSSSGADASMEPREETALVRHEEEAVVETQRRALGSVRARKVVEPQPLTDVVPRDVEHADVDRVPAGEQDSGQIETLPDGSVSIPVFEEELVITKRVVVRERLIVRKHTVTEKTRIDAELRRERVEIDADPGIELIEE